MTTNLTVWEVEEVADSEVVASRLYLNEQDAGARVTQLVREALMDDDAEAELEPFGNSGSEWVHGCGTDFEVWLRRRIIQ